MTKRVSRKTSILASAIVRHVENGGWLGVSWPTYVRGPKGASPKLAYAMAITRYIRKHNEMLSVVSDYNFRVACDDQRALEEYEF